METPGGWPRPALTRTATLLIADHAGAGEAAVAAAGARLLGRVAWRDAAERLAQQGAVGVVLADATDGDEAAIARVLPLLDRLAQGADIQIIVALTPAQIDLVTGGLSDSRIELLCAPSLAERVAALALAGAAREPGRLHDSTREAEAVRLRRLNEEVARIAETLARLTRAEPTSPRPDLLADRKKGYGAPPPIDDTIEIAARDVRDVIRARRLRDHYLGNGLFEDPAWDMLLDLFAADLERAQVSVSSLCIAAAVAPTTALRWIAKLTDAGLFERHPDPFDRRRAFMALSDRARTGMRRYFAAAPRSGVPIA